MDDSPEQGSGWMPERDRAIETILADPMVRVVMKADRVDLQKMKKWLRDIHRCRLERHRNVLARTEGDIARNPALSLSENGAPAGLAAIRTMHESIAAPRGGRATCELSRPW